MEITSFTFVLSVLTLITHIGLLTVGVMWLLRKHLPFFYKLTSFARDNVLQLGFTVALVGTLTSLLYSEFFGLEPCYLCWYQRIFLYPQVVIFAVSLVKKYQASVVLTYAKVLTWIGGVIALYHYLIQVSDVVRSSTQGLVDCSTSGPSCTSFQFMEFGYITIPMMSLTVFVLLIALFQFIKSNK